MLDILPLKNILIVLKILDYLCIFEAMYKISEWDNAPLIQNVVSFAMMKL
jgi:hypothetical protein